MVVLIDTNVILDYLAEREGFFDNAQEIMEICAKGQAQGYVAFHSLPNIWFILRKKPDHIRREMLKQVCTLLTVVSTGHDEVVNAVETVDFKDFEDCLQDKCAVEVKADYIVTRNAADYKCAATKVITPIEFCKLVKK
ncbi:MAG: PIN domain-containing protein [Bacteroidales bacterium]|nr:PIN domain-containing protein [Bacteroidales bacterium]MCM1415396.1 PIN domain-containing protein [bacterium]MCM1423329.1 PIN domain-containing protein [bacterium]